MRKPNFENILAVLARKKPERPTLFEFFHNGPLYERLTGEKIDHTDKMSSDKVRIKAFNKAGYDYTTINASFVFPKGEREHGESVSLNEGCLITDEESFEKYPWPLPEENDYSHLLKLKSELPEGMKIISQGPGGVLENIMSLAGYDNFCIMLFDNPDLAKQIVDNVGSRLVKHYEFLGQYDAVGAMISNDDWGFKSQPMLSPDQMREYIIPWHRKIVKTIHDSGRPAILHSCGNLESIMDDIIDDIGYDGKHSYEDNICPVEEMYEKYSDRIAILGGIDLDFLCRNTPEIIHKRSKAMLELSEEKGGYALGSGNSIPEYVPFENFIAMISAAVPFES